VSPPIRGYGEQSMMTRNDRQEALCRAYVRAVAAQAGVICGKPESDYGVDLCLRVVRIRGRRHLDRGGQIDLQLKSTMLAIEEDTEIKYDLDVTTYDDLREEMDNCPRILVLLVLPDDESKWLEQSPEQLLLRRCVYWLSLTGRPPTKSTSTVRIAIPRANVFSVDAVRLLLNRLQRKDGTS
jgi:hypothetical protein